MMLYGRVQAALYGGGGDAFYMLAASHCAPKDGQHVQRAVYLQGRLQIAICDKAGYLYDCVMIQIQACTELSASDFTDTE